MPSFIDLTGQRFSRLLVVRLADRAGREIRWECRCECGVSAIVRGNQLRSGGTKSCGCLKREASSRNILALRNSNFRHGKRRTPEYCAWSNMIQRCSNAKHPFYEWYGGRGISVCDEWQDFKVFFADMGCRPSLGHSLDRIDVNGHYAPANCRWASMAVQANNTQNNRIIILDGRTDTLSNWVRLFNIHPYGTVAARLRAGIEPRVALQKRSFMGNHRYSPVAID